MSETSMAREGAETSTAREEVGPAQAAAASRPQPEPASDGIQVENPATGEVVATVPKRTPEEVAEMAARAREVQPAWRAMGFDGRRDVLRRCQRWMVDRSDRVIETMRSETGKAYEDCLLELTYVTGAFAFWPRYAPKYLADERVRSQSPFVIGRRLLVRYEPIGVVGVIGPWNYPLANSFGDCIPALAAGNATLLKPSEVTPLTSLLMIEMLRECGLPEGAFQVVTGAGETGAALIDEVDYIMFTGSTGTGKKVMERASRTLTPVSLELGGKDPMIVLNDADLERAANTAVWASFQNSGQTCISTERCYVEEPVYDQFVEMVEERVRKLRQGQSEARGSVDVGAMIFPPQVEIVERHIQDAIDKGARVLAGGHRGDGSGHFFEPTVLVDVDHTMSCMREETFGPTLPIMKVRDAAEGVRMANDSPYGLQGSVFTRNVALGERIARQLEVGTVTVNDAIINFGALELPMGGWKASGLGSRHGPDGIRKYTKRQTILITRLAPKRDLHVFPYTKGRTRAMRALLRLRYGRPGRPLAWWPRLTQRMPRIRRGWR